MKMLIRTRMLVLTLASVALFIGAKPAHAAAMFEFDLTFTQGPVAPLLTTGTFSVDSFSGVGHEEYYSPSSPSPRRLLSFNVSILSNLFEVTGDDFYPVGPVVIFEDGQLSWIGYISTSNFPQLLIQCSPGGVGNCASYLDVNGLSAGTLSGWRPVGVPAAAWLFGSGLLGLIGVSKRKKVA